MALTIESPEAGRLARELSEKTGQSVEEAVLDALRQAVTHPRLNRTIDKTNTDETDFLNRIREIQNRVAKLPVVDDRPPDELVGYDEWGLPH